jgi:hypothetical protein
MGKHTVQCPDPRCRKDTSHGACCCWLMGHTPAAHSLPCTAAVVPRACLYCFTGGSCCCTAVRCCTSQLLHCCTACGKDMTLHCLLLTVGQAQSWLCLVRHLAAVTCHSLTPGHTGDTHCPNPTSRTGLQGPNSTPPGLAETAAGFAGAVRVCCAVLCVLCGCTQQRCLLAGAAPQTADGET